MRAVVKYLDDISDADIAGVNIPTGCPWSTSWTRTCARCGISTWATPRPSQGASRPWRTRPRRKRGRSRDRQGRAAGRINSRAAPAPATAWPDRACPPGRGNRVRRNTDSVARFQMRRGTQSEGDGTDGLVVDAFGQGRPALQDAHHVPDLDLGRSALASMCPPQGPRLLWVKPPFLSSRMSCSRYFTESCAAGRCPECARGLPRHEGRCPKACATRIGFSWSVAWALFPEKWWPNTPTSCV